MAGAPRAQRLSMGAAFSLSTGLASYFALLPLGEKLQHEKPTGVSEFSGFPASLCRPDTLTDSLCCSRQRPARHSHPRMAADLVRMAPSRRYFRSSVMRSRSVLRRIKRGVLGLAFLAITGFVIAQWTLTGSVAGVLGGFADLARSFWTLLPQSAREGITIVSAPSSSCFCRCWAGTADR